VLEQGDHLCVIPHASCRTCFILVIIFFNLSRSGPFHVNRQEYENQATIRSFTLIMRSWRCLLSPPQLGIQVFLPHVSEDRFFRSPKVVKEAIMADINDLVQEFWRTSSYVGALFFVIRRLFENLQQCFDFLKVCFATAVDLPDTNLQRWQNS
jgi:hypothetical protein